MDRKIKKIQKETSKVSKDLSGLLKLDKKHDKVIDKCKMKCSPKMKKMK